MKTSSLTSYKCVFKHERDPPTPRNEICCFTKVIFIPLLFYIGFRKLKFGDLFNYTKIRYFLGLKKNPCSKYLDSAEGLI